MITSIKFTKLYPNSKSPMRKNPTDAGIDFYANNSAVIMSHDFGIIGSGISIQIPEGYMMLLRPKGKNNFLLGAGVVDSFYEPGEIKFKIFNTFDEIMTIHLGDAIGQGIFIPIETPELIEVPIEELKNSSQRSNTGGILNQ